MPAAVSANRSAGLGFRVKTQIERPSKESYMRLAAFSTADLSDVMSNAGTMVGIHKEYSPIQRAVGPAVTVSIPLGGWNMLKMGIEQTRAGDILVVTVHEITSFAMWGGNLSRGAHARGVQAVVIDGAARDIPETQETGLPVFCRAVATGAGPHVAPGEVNIPIACGGVVVNPGDIVVADEDGIVIVPPDAIDDVVRKAEQLKAMHKSVQPVLLRGEVTSIERIRKDILAQGCLID
jgi:4-hydroxy-4-methyl-2-oxoglutarate aldolase